MRAFVALELGNQVTGTLGILIESHKKRGGNIKWIKPSNLHLTLKFLGEVPDQRLPQIQDGMQRAAAGKTAFAFHIQGTGTFPPKSRKPKVLWVGVETHPLLHLLQQSLEDELSKLGFPHENRPFSPHLTIGRVKSHADIGPVLSELELHATDDFGIVQADRLVLFKSTLKPTGAEYSPMFEVGLL